MSASERLAHIQREMEITCCAISIIADEPHRALALSCAFELRRLSILIDGVRDDVAEMEEAIRPRSRRELQAAGVAAPTRFFGRLVRSVAGVGVALLLTTGAVRDSASARTVTVTVSHDCTILDIPGSIWSKPWRT